MLKPPKYITFVLLFLLYAVSFAQGEKFTFKQLTVEDGLSQTSVIEMLQDKKGYLWFGTSNGLNKYDGYNFVIYSNKADDSTSLSSNLISAMFEDRNGNIWIGTVNGYLNRFDRSSETFSRIDLSNDLYSPKVTEETYYEYPLIFARNNVNTITTIAEDQNGMLWIGLWGKGLVQYNPKTGARKQIYYEPGKLNTLSSNKIMKVLIDSDGTIWAGTFGSGLNKIQPSVLKTKIEKSKSYGFTYYQNSSSEPFSLSDNRVISLYEDKHNNIWVGTYKGLNKLDRKQRYVQADEAKFVKYFHNPENKNSVSNDVIMNMIEDMEGYLWIGTFGGGLNRFNQVDSSFISFQHNPADENTIADNDVLSLCQDRSGIIWIGTHLGKGINKLLKNKQKFNLIKFQNNLPNTLNDNVVYAVLEHEGILWIGTYKGGLNKVDLKTGRFSYIKNIPGDPNSLSDNHVRSIEADNYGNLWIGTYSGGLNKLNIKSGKIIRYMNDPADPSTISVNQVRDIYIDKEDNVWLAAFGGGLTVFNLNYIDKPEFQIYKHDPLNPYSINDNRVYSIYEDKEGNFWIGTFGGGLNKFDKYSGRFKSFYKPDGNDSFEQSERVMSAYQDSRGVYWFGTYGYGLYKFENNKFRRYSSKGGLLSDVVYCVLEDKNGILWISSDNGLFKYNPNEKVFYQYDIDDGLQSKEFSGGAFYKTKDGKMYFGGINGLNYFYPENIKDNPYIPPVVITSIKIFGNNLKGERNYIDLPYDENFLSFEFAALDFTNPRDNHYAFKMEGFDKEWQYTHSDLRMANYTNLPPGEYVFKVKGTNNDEIWNSEGTSLNITITPPYWQTWWFMFLSILLVGISIYYLSTVKIKNQLAMEKLKTKLAADLHDNIGSGLTEISILSELASNNNQVSTGHLKNISDISRQLVDSMSDIVWVVNPKRDSLYDLIIRLKDIYGDLLSSMGISFKTVNLENLYDVKLPPEYKQNLFLIFKEGINNCIKHSKCKKIVLEANIQGNNIEVLLKDDGIGIDNNNNSQYGNGIKNIETRARNIGADVKWTSSSSGTVISFSGKINKIKKLKYYFNRE